MFRLGIDDNSIYHINDNEFNMIVTDYRFDGNKLSLTLDGDEELVGVYYIDTHEELLYLKDNIKYGVSLYLTGSLEEPINNTIPNTFNYKEYLNNKGIRFRLVIDSIEVIDSNIGVIYKLKNIINNRIDNIDDTGYMKAFILGDINDIDKEVYTSYQKIGIVHLFAFSGTYIILICSIILRLFKRLSYYKKYIIISIILIICGFIVGFNASIKRCILFFIFNGLNKIFKLEIESIKVLLLVLITLFFYDYKIIYDIGFLYSFITVFGIMIGSSFINHDNKLIGSFRLCLVAFIFSLPISLSNFYEVNLLSIFYNMVFVPFVSVIVYPLGLLSFIIPSLSLVFNFTINILEVSSSFLCDINVFNVYLSFNIIECGIYYLISFIMFYRDKFRLGMVLCLIVIVDIIMPYLDSNGYVYFFDVGQGDSSLVISPYRKDIILIDTGGVVSYVSDEWMSKSTYYVSDNVVSFMKSIGIKSIDLLILSHGDADHANEVDNIIKDIDIKCLNINLGEINRLESNSMKYIDTCLYKPKNMVLKYLNTSEYDNENDNSLLTYMKIYNTSILSLGDASTKVEEDLITKYELSNIDIFKLSHHGSKTSSSYKFLSSINPKIGIISSGRNNRFNHPSIETIDTLDKLNIDYYNTQIDGSIKFTINKGIIEIDTYEP